MLGESRTSGGGWAGERARRSGGENLEWHLRREKSNNVYLLPLFPLEKEMVGGGGGAELGEGEGGKQRVVEREREAGNMLGNLIKLSAPQ